MADPVAFLDQQFRCRDVAGAVHVRVWANSDPIATGHDLIAANFDREAFAGFPLVLAEVEYPACGPRAIFYWLQTVTQVHRDGTVHAEVDTVHGPFYAFGHKPTLMDAPANPDHPDMDWVARSYLMQSPRIIARDRLDVVAGFTWEQVVATYRSAFPELELHA